jgi:4-aminobutyrate aminotransferase-like enzyme
MAKGIASGMPLSGILAHRDLLAKLPAGTHGGTYGGNVVSCAAALATLDVLEDEDLVANARARGAQLVGGLRELQADHPAIGDVRGLGAMVAMEFVKPGTERGAAAPDPDPDLAKRVIAGALERQLIVLSAGSYANVSRIIPPLVTTSDEVDRALSILEDSVRAAGA